MSIILKGIDLPKDDSFCMVVGITNAGSDITIFYKDITKGKEHRGIEAIQIPKGHGVIKDINTFLKDKCLTEYIENDVFNKKYSYTIGTDAIYNAPTILEAEE